VTDVVVDGRTVVSGRRHLSLGDVPSLLDDAIVLVRAQIEARGDASTGPGG